MQNNALFEQNKHPAELESCLEETRMVKQDDLLSVETILRQKHELRGEQQNQPNDQLTVPKSPSITPKRLSAYMLYFLDTKTTLMLEFPQIPLVPLTKIISKWWNRLDSVSKQAYFSRAEGNLHNYQEADVSAAFSCASSVIRTNLNPSTESSAPQKEKRKYSKKAKVAACSTERKSKKTIRRKAQRIKSPQFEDHIISESNLDRLAVEEFRARNQAFDKPENATDAQELIDREQKANMLESEDQSHKPSDCCIPPTALEPCTSLEDIRQHEQILQFSFSSKPNCLSEFQNRERQLQLNQPALQLESQSISQHESQTYRQRLDQQEPVSSLEQSLS